MASRKIKNNCSKLRDGNTYPLIFVTVKMGFLCVTSCIHEPSRSYSWKIRKQGAIQPREQESLINESFLSCTRYRELQESGREHRTRLGVPLVGTGRAAADPAENPPVLQDPLTLSAATVSPVPWPSRITPGLLPDVDA